MTTELWVALDVPSGKEALEHVRILKPHVDVFKIGLELFTAEGPDVVSKVKNLGCDVFLDLKLHDIPNTVAGAVRNLTKLGVDYIDIHIAGGTDMLVAAKDAAAEEALKNSMNPPKLLGITVLTSIDSRNLEELLIDKSTEALVARWAYLAKKCGLSGSVNSLKEVEAIRDACGVDFMTVTPGIRHDLSEMNDQRRTGTPQDAVALGATAIVVGRPILTAQDPAAVASKIKNELTTSS